VPELHAAHRHAILLVDDYADLREALTCELELDGSHVVAVGSGPEALAILKAGYCPCVVLLDYVMPGMDGCEVRARMQADPELTNVPVVMLSGASTLIHERDEGAPCIVAKPPMPGELARVIARCVRCQRGARS
jgi:CheY-like chemotaxis protein